MTYSIKNRLRGGRIHEHTHTQIDLGERLKESRRWKGEKMRCGGDGRSWWMSTLLFWQRNLLQSWQCVMEAREIPGAVPFSIWKGRTTCQNELDEPFIVWPALGWVTAVGPRCLQKAQRRNTGQIGNVSMSVLTHSILFTSDSKEETTCFYIFIYIEIFIKFVTKFKGVNILPKLINISIFRLKSVYIFTVTTVIFPHNAIRNEITTTHISTVILCLISLIWTKCWAQKASSSCF